MAATLFPEPSQPRTSPLGGAEPVVHWLTESTTSEATVSRDVVNRWYRDFPDTRQRLFVRLRSQDDIEHLQALDELFVHSLLRKRHTDVRYEEKDKAPDFRVYRDDKLVGGIEVLSLFQRQDWTDKQRLHYRLSDELNRRVAPTAGYFANLTIVRAEGNPAPRHFSEWIRARISNLPPHDQLVLPPNATLYDLPSATYERRGVHVDVTFIPMHKDAPSKSNPDARIAGMGPLIGGVVNSGARLKDRIEAKAGGRYRLDDRPFLVAVGIHDTFCDTDEVATALYGPDVVDIEAGSITRTPSGLFGVDIRTGQSSNSRLSAVATLSTLRLWEPESASVVLFHNPAARSTWPEGVLPTNRQIGGMIGDSRS